nr:uncharacterized protein LOC128694871 [Cherax quadricarinatus]XP_053641196.1 uncharacterized protein LOC128694871 [Cherax quadricarinatus]XP_053641197.1 uncharacterized protein LOC128694871 [Cherax quadricarinatus]
MDENQAVPFFTCLRYLCRNVDKQTALLKEELKLPAGEKPQNYDKGLRKIKNEVQDLKNLSVDVHHRLKSFGTFSSYLKSIQENLNLQAIDIDKLERYLSKFGYKPQKNSPVIQNDVTETSDEKQNAVEECSIKQTEATAETLKQEGTPVLSDVTLRFLQDKDLLYVKPLKKVNTSASSNIDDKIMEIKTPVRNPHDGAKLSVSLASLARSCVTVEQWLSGIEESIDLTPDIIPMHKMPLRKKVHLPSETNAEKCNESSEDHMTQLTQTPVIFSNVTGHESEDIMPEIPSDLQVKSASKKPCFEVSPEEPPVYEYTKQIIMKPFSIQQEQSTEDTSSNYTDAPIVKTACSVTPEEPSLSAFSSAMSRLIDESTDSYTPEEPVLSYQDYQSLPNLNSEINDNTPEEPVLSYQLKKNKENVMSKESAEITNSGTPQRPNSELPCSPQLSEITQSFLSLNLHSANTLPLHLQRDLYKTKSSHKQESKDKKVQSVYSASNDKYSKHTPLGRSFSDNSLRNQYLSQDSSFKIRK